MTTRSARSSIFIREGHGSYNSCVVMATLSSTRKRAGSGLLSQQCVLLRLFFLFAFFGRWTQALAKGTQLSTEGGRGRFLGQGGEGSIHSGTKRVPSFHPLPWMGQHRLPMGRLLFHGVHPLFSMGRPARCGPDAQSADEIVATSLVIVPNGYLQNSLSD